MLTMEFAEGVPVTDLFTLHALGINTSQLSHLSEWMNDERHKLGQSSFGAAKKGLCSQKPNDSFQGLNRSSG